MKAQGCISPQQLLAAAFFKDAVGASPKQEPKDTYHRVSNVHIYTPQFRRRGHFNNKRGNYLRIVDRVSI